MANSRNTPKTQVELRQENITPYVQSIGKVPVANPKARELQRKGDPRKFDIGLKDIDETIYYYFENVIRPSVIQNGKPINVPIIYGSPERWAAVQKDGFYRDKKGKIQTPLIMFKRTSMEKNRNLGNKLDANSPQNRQIFEKKYTQKNIYDHFGLVNNRWEVKEYQGVVIPDYYDLEYSCIIFTDYTEQMNKIVEAISYASDSYWGDPNKFSFRAMIDNYTMAVELAQGTDRAVKTSFSIKMLGHIIPDTINAQLQGSLKTFSKASLKFGIELEENSEFFSTTSKAPTRNLKPSVLDIISPILHVEGGISAEEKQYLSTQRVFTSGTKTVIVSGSQLTWKNITISTPPTGFPALSLESFQVFVNGRFIEIEAIDSITQSGSDVVVVLNANLDFSISDTDEFIITGKFL